MVTFEEALTYVKRGGSITRVGWNGKNLFVRCQSVDAHSKMTQPYLYLFKEDIKNTVVPWVPSQGDLFANDWELK